jgi:hypothetical protein
MGTTYSIRTKYKNGMMERDRGIKWCFPPLKADCPDYKPSNLDSHNIDHAKATLRWMRERYPQSEHVIVCYETKTTILDY